MTIRKLCLAYGFSRKCCPNTLCLYKWLIMRVLYKGIPKNGIPSNTLTDFK